MGSYILITLQSCPIEIKEVRNQKISKLKNHDSQNVPGAGCLCVNDSSQTSSSQTQLLLQSCLVLLGRSGRILWRRMSVWSNDGSMWSSLSPGPVDLYGGAEDSYGVCGTGMICQDNV